MDGLLRIEKAIGFLIAKKPGLDFDVSAVIVGKGLSPLQAIRVAAQEKIFFEGRSLLEA